MSIYCTFSVFDADGEGGDYPQPYRYRESHVLPSKDDPRGGFLDLAYIPGFITRDGRDVDGELDPQCENEGVWPFLRFSLRPEHDPSAVGVEDAEDTVVLDREQVVALRDELNDWLLRCDDWPAWLEKRQERAP